MDILELIRRTVYSYKRQYLKKKGLWNLLKYHGPDLATYGSRGISTQDAKNEAVEDFMQQLHILLPRRYVFILERLRNEGLLDQETLTTHTQMKELIIEGDTIHYPNGKSIKRHNLQMPWVTDKRILNHCSPALGSKIREFVEDYKNLQVSMWGL